MIDLRAIRAADLRYKPANADITWGQLAQYHDDVSRSLTVENLQRLGLGLRENIHPVEINLLAYVMQRLNVVYSDPPSRYLLRPNGKRVAETQAQHKLLLKSYALAGIDVAMRAAASRTALLSQVFLRLYPIDARGSVVLRVFDPQHVLREPNPASADLISEDPRFALRLADDVYECWERTGDGWHCEWQTDKGQLTETQPFDGAAPYASLPLVQLTDGWAGGRAWIPPKASRVGLVEAINAQANDLLNLGAIQGHGQWVYRREDPNTKIPAQTGAGTVWEVGANDTVENITPTTNIAQVREVLQGYVRLFLAVEGLPPDELDGDRQVYSGAQLQAAERTLMERREAQLPICAAAERDLFRAFRAVHNVHAAGWGSEPFDEDLEVGVEFGDIDQPVDSKDQIETLTNGLAARLISPIDALQRVHSCSREQAIQIAERIAADFEAYPLQVDAPDGTQAQPLNPDGTPIDAVNALGNEEPADSMVDAVNGTSAAERRAARR